MFTDESLMPFGKFKGNRLVDVPARYLLYLHRESIARDNLKAYIEDNLEVLEKEVQNKNNTNDF